MEKIRKRYYARRIRIFALKQLRRGWRGCNGKLISRGEYNETFSKRKRFHVVVVRGINGWLYRTRI